MGAGHCLRVTPESPGGGNAWTGARHEASESDTDMAEDTEPKERSPLELAEERRATRKAEARKAQDAQRAQDIEAIDALEVEHGDSNVGVIHVPFSAGLPTCAAVRCPKPAELKRFRHRVTPKHEKDHPDSAAAAEELAAVCRVYPDESTYARLCAARPGLATQLGAKAVDLATGKAEAEGK